MISNTPNSTRSSSRASAAGVLSLALIGLILLTNCSISHIGYYLYPFGHQLAGTVILLSGLILVLRGVRDVPFRWSDDPVFVALIAWSALVVARGVPEGELPNTRMMTWAPLPLLYLVFRSVNDRDLKPIVLSLLVLCPLVSWYLGQNRNEFSFVYIGYLTLCGLWSERALPWLLLEFGIFSGVYLDCRSAILASLAALAYWKTKSLKMIFGAVAAGGVIVKLIEIHYYEPLHFRDVLIRLALESFRESPFIGQGYGKYHRIVEGERAGMGFEHAHCFPATVLADLGLAGAFAFGLFIFAVCRRWRTFPLVSQLILIQYGIWMFFDEPLQWMSGWSIMLLALTRKAARDES
ncbi:MAG: hypothetical protein U0136_08725 [Bdellovibrionota bacterium]